MKTRVIMHTPEPLAGSAQYVSELVKALHSAGQAVVLFCPRNFAYAQELSGAGASIICSGNRSTASSGLVSRIVRNLRYFAGGCLRQMRITRPQDIVHFQFPLYFPAGLVMFLLARIQARAIVYTAHDPVPHKWLLPGYLRFIERGCLSWAYSLSDRIIVHNQAGKDVLIRVFSQRPSKIAIVPHGSSALKPAEVSFRNSGTLDLLMFGSIREDKGIELAIAAVQKINADGLRVRLLIAGAVANAREQAYWDDCKRTIQSANTGITFREQFVPDSEIPVLLSGCDAVLLPYKNFESESGVAAVALANGRAIVAANTGSFGAILSAADLGIAIQSPSVAGVEEAIRRALAMGASALHQKGLCGLEYARSTRSWEGVAEQTADLYAAASIKSTKQGNEKPRR